MPAPSGRPGVRLPGGAVPGWCRGDWMDANLIEATGLVDKLHEATRDGHTIVADGALRPELLRDLRHTAEEDGHRLRDDFILWLHPAQWHAMEEYVRADKWPLITHGGKPGMYAFEGIPAIQSKALPPAVVYLLSPDAITLGGQVLHPRKVYRLTGLTHPDTR